jgi:hypothetical protein
MLMRFVVGGGGLVWCLLVNRLEDPIALLVFGALATSTDVFGFARALIQQAREATLEIEEEADRMDHADRKAAQDASSDQDGVIS